MPQSLEQALGLVTLAQLFLRLERLNVMIATQHGYVMLELAGLAPPDLADDGAAYEA